MSHLLDASSRETIPFTDHDDCMPITVTNNDVTLSTTPPITLINDSNDNASSAVCFVKVRSVDGILHRSVDEKYWAFTCGRPNRRQLPSSVTVLLWGGLSGYCQELQRKQSRESWVALIVIAFILVLFVIVNILPFLLVGNESTSDVFGMCINLLISFSSIMFLFTNPLTYKFDKEMDRIVSTKLGPVFRKFGHSELCYYNGRSLCSSYAYFTIKKLPSSISTSATGNDEEEQADSNNHLMVNLDDDDTILFGSSLLSVSLFVCTIFNRNKTNVPRIVNEIVVPVFGTKYYNRSLEMSVRPKDLKVNMFVWGMIVECFHKVELLPRVKQFAKAMKIMALLFIPTISSVRIVFGINVNWFLSTLLAVTFCCYVVGSFVAMSIEPYPCAEVLHQQYERALNEIAPIIEQNSMYCVEYTIANNGRSSQLLFRLKQQQYDDNL